MQLEKHGIQQLIVAGPTAHTCVEATVRFAAEPGYEVTVANHSDQQMYAAPGLERRWRERSVRTRLVI